MTRQYYTDLELADAVASSFSFMEVARKLGLKSHKTPNPPPSVEEILSACKSDRRTINLFVKAGAESSARGYCGKQVHAGLPIPLAIIYKNKNLLNRSSKNITFLCPNYIVLGKHVQA